VEETMSFVPCKAADLKEGDRVRVTLEGVVTRLYSGSVAFLFPDDEGPGRISWSFASSALDAGKLEREERPLQVGDRVLSRDPSDDGEGVVVAIRGRRVCTDWTLVGLDVWNIDQLVRAS
jgi:hypothetical protein